MDPLYKDSIVNVELETGIDLTDATDLQIRVTYPSGVKATWTATQSSPTQIRYRTQAGDLSEVGHYIFYAHITLNGLATPGDPFLVDVLDPSTAPITIDLVRAAINIPEQTELSDVAIESAIDRAASYILVLRSRYSAPAEYFPAGERAYANYLAYQTYSDRVLNVPPGSYQQGKWDPVTEEIVRSTGDKLSGLKEAYEDILGIIKSFPVMPMGVASSSVKSCHKFDIGQHDFHNHYSLTH